ncbi:MAG: DUF973 family protein [Saccharolobus sp.]|uniref:DUF973 family protein n=1 Tax=Saccharolobus shibatae (strain ATCC 51178 / DSM 5389 / JCM 8931 / NBRC 15437 / B12) TaxID=523848 RepID=A0A8F5GU02_SACSH|nr:DUF973 family protein [Saccharolobus shibatae]MCH4816425.1 DUF973 family protein [Saccharolobus shibatae]QXJ29430.1 hypothetical protein J5U23_02299 [Saccharolobus shibatae B12]
MESSIQALKNIKTGSLYYFLATIIALVTEVIILSEKSLVSSFFVLILELVTYGILLIGFSRMRMGFFQLSKTINARIGITGVNIFIIGIIALLFGAILPILIYIGGSLVFIGDVMIGYTIYKIGQRFQVNTEKIAGILIMISIASFIGYLISYFASDEVMRKASQAPREEKLLIVPSDKSIGYGILKSNGDANVVIYSKESSEIISAQIMGHNFQTLQISPKTVVAGENKIYIKFALSGVMFVPGNIYNLEILLANNEKLLASLVYEL